MRKGIIIALMLFGAVAASAQALANVLIIESKGGEKFYLSVDGFKRNKEAASRVEVKGIYATTSRITVVFEDTLKASVRNYQVLLVPERGKNEVRPMNNYVARYQLVAGKKRTKVKRISINRDKNVPDYNPMPATEKER